VPIIFLQLNNREASMLKNSTAPLEQRMLIFKALVEAQDQKLNVRQSRKAVADEYGISEKLIKQIEDEGIDHEWPPL
jgi:hypothetical protein